MNNAKSLTMILALLALAAVGQAQSMKLGEVVFVSTSPLKKDVKPESVQAFKESVSAWNAGKGNVSMHLSQADRGKRKGDFLLVCGALKATDRTALPSGSPFGDKNFAAGKPKASDILENPMAYTEYRLIGANKFNPQRPIGLLGIHYIKVKPDRAAAFEKFVVEKLHPAVGQVLPDMQLLYYKAVAGDQAGSYITIFAIDSYDARHKYWPAGSPETEVLKKAFMPHRGLGEELGAYLVEDSYLLPAGGAAAYFESKEWTDYLVQ